MYAYSRVSGVLQKSVMENNQKRVTSLMFIFTKNHHGKNPIKRSQCKWNHYSTPKYFQKKAYYKKAVSLEQSVTNGAAYIFIGI